MILENTVPSEDIYVGDVVVISGVRPAGRRFSRLENGRSKHGLLYICNGEATFELDHGRILKATDRQLLYLPTGLKYKLQYTAESTAFVLVNFLLFRKNAQPFTLYDDITVLFQDDTTHTVANIMRKLEMCSAAQNLAGHFRRKELLFRLLAALYSDNGLLSEPRQHPQIAKGVLLLKQTYLEGLPIETFAKQSGLSESAFRQLFQKQYGMSPLQYRNRLRIQRAKQLLEYDHCTVAEAAYASGFENIGYFCRCYKKITGQTPKQTKQSAL